MPQTAAQTRAKLAERSTNPLGGQANPTIVTATLKFAGRQYTPEDLMDALVEKYGNSGLVATVLAGAQNDLTFIARRPSVDPVTVTYVVAGNNTPLSVAVVGKAITVNVATGAGGAATSTAAQVRDAVNGDATASGLVFAQNAAANDGTGIVTAMAAQSLTTFADSKVTCDKDSLSRGNLQFTIAT